MDENLLSIQEAAKRLKVTTKTLRRWEAKGILIPNRTAGLHRRYTEAQIAEFIARLKQNTPAPQPPVILPTTQPQIAQASFSQPAQPQAELPSTLNETNVSLHSLVSKPLTIGYKHATRTKALFISLWFSTASRLFLGATVATALALLLLFVSIPSLQNFLRSGLGKVVNLQPVTKVDDSLFAKSTLPIKGDIIFQGNVYIKGKLTVDSTIDAANYPPQPETTNSQTNTSNTTNNGTSLVIEDNSGLDLVNGVLTNTDRGSSQKIFKTIKAGTTTTDATSNTDTFEFASGTGISLSLDNHNKKLTIINTGNNSDGITSAGDGLSLSSKTVNLDLISTADGTGSTASFSGFEFGGSDNQVGLLQGCANGELLKWNSTSKEWECSVDLNGAGGSVTSVDSLSGALTISNTTGSGSNITIDDASTGAKGIAQFNATNFSVASGAVNTIQNISSASSPTFSGITLSGLSTAGIVHNSAAGLLTTSALNLAGGASEITGALPYGNGGTGLSSTPINGQVLIGNGSGYNLATLTQGTGITISNGVGTISIASTLGTSVDLASEITGTLPVGNGGTGATTFTAGGILFGNTTSPVASSAQGSAGQVLLSGGAATPTWTVGTLTLAGNLATSGVSAITLTSTGSTNITLPTTGTLSTLAGNEALSNKTINGLTPASQADGFTIAGGTTSRTFTISGNDVSLNQNLLTTSSPSFSGLTLSGFNNCDLKSNGSGVTICGVDNNGGGSNWTLANGTLSPNNNTLDILLGGNSSVSAKFAFLGVNGTRGTQTASISGTIVLDSTGSIQTTNKQTLTIGGNTTGNIALSPLGGNGRVDSTGDLNLSTGKSYLVNGISVLNETSLGSGITGSSLTSVGTITSGIWNGTAIGSQYGGTGINGSAAGNGTILIGNGSGYTLANLTAGTGINISNGAGSISISSTIVPNSKFTQNDSLGLLYPNNGTVDFLVGGNSSASAKFAILGIAGARGSQTASLSGSIVLDTAGSIQTTNKQSLTIGGNTTGNIVLSNFGTGILKSNASGILSSSAVNLATADITGTLGVTNGGTGASSVGGAGSIVYSNGSILAYSGVGTPGDCLISTGASTPTWGGCSGGGASGWLVSAGLFYPTDPTLDLAVGGTSTISARFGIFGVNTDTPVASISASSGYGISLGYDGILQTTKNQTLTIGGNTTGNISLLPNGGNDKVISAGTISVATGKTYQVNGIDVLSSSGLGTGITGSSLTSVGTLTGGTWNATAIGSQYGGTGINTSAATGVPTISGGTWSVSSTLATVLGGLGADVTAAGAGELLYSTGTTTYGHLAAGINGQCLTSSGASTPVWGACGSSVASPFGVTLGSIIPFNSTEDFLIGGQATSSAKFGILGVNGARGTQIATLSGSLTLDSTGSIQTTNKQTLTIGGNTTGDVAISGIGTGVVHANTGVLSTALVTNAELANSTITVTGGTGLGVSGSPVALGGTIALSNTGVTSNLSGAGISVSGATGAVTISNTGVLSLVGGTSGGAITGALTIANSTSAGSLITIDDASAVAKGIASFNSTNFSVASGVVNTIQNISTISSPTFNGLTLSGLTLTGFNNCTLKTDGSGVTTCGTDAIGSNYWTQTSGSLAPINSTVDFLVGGQATTSAKFAITGVNNARGQQTASLSGNLVLDAAGSIQTTNNQTLTIGGTTTGNITLSPNAGTGTVLSTGDLNLSSGKSYFINGTNVLSGSTLGSGITGSSLTSIGALTGGSIASGFGTIFTTNTIQGTDITASGTTGFVSSGAGADILFNASGTHTISASSGTLELGAVTLTGSIAGNSQNITGLGTINGLAITADTGVITSGTWNGTAIGAQYGGTGINGSAAGNGTVLIGNGSGYTLANLTAGTGINISNGAGTISISQAAAYLSPFGQNTALGTIFENNTTQDFLLGGISTSSAKFAVIGINNARGSQTASLSGSLVLDTTGSLQTTNNQTLTIGGATTGNITLSPLGGSGTLLSTGDLNLSNGKSYFINGTSVLSGTTLGAGITGSSLTSVGTLAGGTWNATAIGAAYGGTGINTSASTGVPTISSGTWSVSAQLSALRGGTGVDGSSAGNGTILIGNGSGYTLANISGGTGITITNGSGTISIAQTPSANPFNSNLGAIFENNTTQDFLIGGQATSSAKFAILGVNNDTPVASISASNGNGISLGYDGIIQTTKNQTLTLGGNSTGNIVLLPQNTSGGVSIGKTSNAGIISVRALSTGTGLEFGSENPNQGSTATFISIPQIINSGKGIDISNTISGGSGTTAYGISIGGGISGSTDGAIGLNIGGTINGSNAKGIYINGSSAINNSYGIDISGSGNRSADFNSTLLNLGATLTFPFGGVNNVTSSYLNANRPITAANTYVNVTGDLASLSSNCTTTGSGTCVDTSNILRLTQSFGKASGAVLNIVNNGIGSATAITSNSGGQSALIINKTGVNDIFTASASGTTRLTLDTSGNLNISGGDYKIGSTSVLSGTTLGTGITGSSLTSVGTITSGTWNATAIGSTYGGTGQNFSGSTGVPSLSSGTWSVASTLSTALGGLGANVSAAGAGELLYSTSTTAYGHLAAGIGGQCLTSGGTGAPVWTSCATASGLSTYWDQSNGALSPFNSTVDFLLGGQASTSAKFAILGVNNARGTQTASLSGNLVLDAAGSLQTTKNQTLTVGGNTTGNIILSANNGSGTVNSTSDFTLANGKSYFINGTNVLSGSTLGTGILSSSLTSVGALTGGFIANGFGTILTANTIQGTDITASGTTGLVASGAGADLLFNASGTHTISASSGTLELGAVTLAGAIAGNSQNITGLGTINGLAITANTGVITTGTWNGTAIAAQYGGTGINTSGSTGVPTISSGTWSVAAQLSALRGGTGVDGSSAGNGTVLIGNGSGYSLANLTAGNGISITNGAGTISIAQTPSSNPFNSNLGAIFENNTTQDFLIGSQSTSSAKFAILNVNSGIPTATVSAGINGATYITADGTLATTSKQNITIGGSTSGDITLTPSSKITLGGTIQAFTLGGNITGTGTPNISGLGTISGNVFQGTGSVTFGQAGQTTSITGSSVSLSNLTTNGFVKTSGSTGLLSVSTTIDLGTEVSGILSPVNGGSPFGQNNSLGTIFENNTTLDVLLGGTSSSSAKFAFLGINNARGSQTASLSGNLVLDTSGSLQTTNNQTLTIGGSTTGSITLSPLNGTGVTTNTGSFNLSSGKTYQIAGTDVLSGSALGTGILGSSLTSVGTLTGGTWNGTAIAAQYGGTGINTSGSTGVPTISSGTWSVAAQLSALRGGTGVDGSSAGNGTVLIGNGSGYSLANLTAGTGISITNGAGTISIAQAPSANPFNSNLGTIFENNTTQDFLLGSQSSSSAKFAILGVNNTRGLQTASLSGNLVLDAVSSIQTTNNQTLTFGGNTTGNIILSPNNGNGTVNSTSDINLASGKAYYINGVNVLSGSTLGSGITSSSLTSVGTISTGVWNATAIGAQYGGTGINGSAAGNGTVLIGNGSGYSLANLTAGTGISITNGSGYITIAQNPSANPFTSSLGAIYENNISQDFLLGGVSSTSAKFAVIGINNTRGNQTASLSGNLVLDAAGSLQTTLNQTLTIGGNTTGNITLSPNNGSGIVTSTGDLNLSSGKAFTINGTSVLNGITLGTGITGSSLTSVGTLTGGTWNSTAIAAQYGGTGINTSGSTGVPTISSGTWSVAAQLSTLRGGTGVDGSSAGNGTVLIGNGSGYSLANLTAGTGISITNGSGTISIGQVAAYVSPFGQNASTGTIFENNTTEDFLLGGIATTSAKFAVLGIAGTTTPTASVSAQNAGGQALVLGGDGSIQSVRNNTLTIGGNTTGDISFKPGNVSNPALYLGSNGNVGIGTGAPGSALDVVGSLLLGANSTIDTRASGTLSIGTASNTSGLSLGRSGNTTTFNSTSWTATPTISGLVTGTLGFSVANGQSYTGAGTVTLSSAVNNDLTLMAAGTGNTIITSDLDTGVKIGSSTNTIAPLSVSGGIGSNALSIFNQTNGGDILAASASGVTKFTIANDGTASTSAGFTINGIGTIQSTKNQTLTLGGGSTGNLILGKTAQVITLPGLDCSGSGNGGKLTTTSGGVLTCSADSIGTGTYSPFQESIVLGINYQVNTTEDFLVGGVGTTSAKFAILGVAGTRGTQTASISGNLVLDAAGSLQTTLNQTLTIGGDTTGNINFKPGNSASSLFLGSNGNVGIGTSAPGSALDVVGSLLLGANSTIDTRASGTLSIGTAATTTGLTLGRSGNTTTFNSTSWTATPTISGLITATSGVSIANGQSYTGAGTVTVSSASNNNLTISALGSGTTIITSDEDTGLKIGTSSNTIAPLSVSGGIGSNALAIFNQINGTDILAASAAGVTKFVVKNDGTASSSAGFSVDGVGNIQSTRLQTLTVGGGSTGNLVLGRTSQVVTLPGFDCSASGSGGKLTTTSGGVLTCSADTDTTGANYWQYDTTTGIIAPGNLTTATLFGSTASTSALLRIAGTANSGTVPVASVSATSSYAALVVDNSGLGDLFTASSSGLNRFVITQSGNVGIGTSAPGSALDVVGSILLGANSTIDTRANGTLSIGTAATTTGLTLGRSGNTTTFNSTAWTATPTISGLVTGTSGFSVASGQSYTGAGAVTLSSASNTDLTLFAQGTGNTIVTSDQDTGLKIGTSANAPAALSVSGGIGSNAGFILNRVGSTDDIFAASSSGTTRFVIKNDGTASSSAGFTIDGIGNIQSTNNQTLTLGGSTSGNIILSPQNGSGRIGINNTNPQATLDILGVSGATIPAASISGNLIVMPTVGAGGNVGIGTIAPTAALDVVGYKNLISVGTISIANFSGNQTSPAVGGTYMGVSSSPSFTNSTGGSLGVMRAFYANPTTNGNASLINILNSFDSQPDATLGTVTNMRGYYAQIKNTGGTVGTGTGLYIDNPSGTIGTLYSIITNTLAGRAGIGTLTPKGQLEVSGGTFGGNAALIVNQTGTSTNDIFTASSAGTTKFTIKNDGTASSSAGFTIDGIGNVQSTLNQTLTLGGSTTGNIALMPQNGTGNVGIGTASPTDKLEVSGNIKIGAQTNSALATQQTFTKISNAAGTIASGGTSGIASISATAVFEGSLYIGTFKSIGGAEVYRYDGTSTNWTKVSQATAGTIAASGTSGIASVSAMTVWNGNLYAGTSSMNQAEVYRYDGGTNWTKVSGAAGTFATTTAIDGIASMTVYGGNLMIGTREPGKAELYRFNGGTSWTAVNNTAGTFIATDAVAIDAVTTMVVKNNILYMGTAKNAAASTIRYDGGIGATNVFFGNVNATGGGGSYMVNGAAAFGYNEVTAMTVYNGSVVVALRKPGGAADVLMLADGNSTAVTSTPDNWVRLNSAAGTMTSGGTSSIDNVDSLVVYNGRLYAGTKKAGAQAEIYRYESIGTWTRLYATGKLDTGATGIDSIVKMIQYNGDLILGTYKQSGGAEVYKYTSVLDQSFALKFNASSTLSGGTQNGLNNEGSIYFMATASANLNSTTANTGSFIFSHGIITSTGAYDVAEDYPTRDTEIQPGDIVEVDPNEKGYVRRSTGVYAHGLLGVYSEKPGFRLSQVDNSIDGSPVVPIALAGRVPVRVSIENGPISAGDYLTSSSVAGVAMKATKSGNVIGKAMEAFNSSGEGKILVYVNASQTIGENLSGIFAQTGMGAVASDQNSNYATFLNLEGNSAGRMSVNSGGGISYTSASTGYSEWYKKDITSEQIEAGDMICMGQNGVTKCNETDGTILGVASDATAVVGNSKHENDPSYVLVTLLGQAKVNIKGTVSKKDLIGSSNEAGKGNTVISGYTLGTALENSTSTSSSIMVTVIPTYHVSSLAMGAPLLALATSSGQNDLIATGKGVENQIEDNKDSIATLTQSIASMSARLNKLEESKKLTLIPFASTSSDFATVAQDLLVYGTSSFNNASVQDTLSIGNSMRITESGIDTIGTGLSLQSLKQGALDLMAGAVIVTTDGVLHVNENAEFGKDVAIKGVLSATSVNLPKGTYLELSDIEATSSATAGKSSIKHGKTYRRIFNPYVKGDSLIYVTPTTRTIGTTPFVSEQSDGKFFIVEIENAIENDLEFNFLIINRN